MAVAGLDAAPRVVLAEELVEGSAALLDRAEPEILAIEVEEIEGEERELLRLRANRSADGMKSEMPRSSCLLVLIIPSRHPCRLAGRH